MTEIAAGRDYSRRPDHSGECVGQKEYLSHRRSEKDRRGGTDLFNRKRHARRDASPDIP